MMSALWKLLARIENVQHDNLRLFDRKANGHAPFKSDDAQTWANIAPHSTAFGKRLEASQILQDAVNVATGNSWRIGFADEPVKPLQIGFGLGV
jgi:hypothetical protein